MAGTTKTPQEIIDYTNANINTNGVNAITGAKLNVPLVDLAENLISINTKLDTLTPANSVVNSALFLFTEDGLGNLVATLDNQPSWLEGATLWTITANDPITINPKPTGELKRFTIFYVELGTDVENREIFALDGDDSLTPQKPISPAGYLTIGEVLITNAGATPIQIGAENVIYLGEHGNDANTGRNMSIAVRTLDHAISLCLSNQIYTIICLDAGTYTMSAALDAGLFNFFMPNASILLDSSNMIDPDIFILGCNINITASQLIWFEKTLTIFNADEDIDQCVFNIKRISTDILVSNLYVLDLKGCTNLIGTLSSDSFGDIYTDTLINQGFDPNNILNIQNVYGYINGVLYTIVQTEKIDFDLTPSTDPNIVGRLQWSAAEKTLEFGVEGGTIDVGKEVFDYYVDTNNNLVEGNVVSVTGISGNRQAVEKTNNSVRASATACIGMVTHKNVDNTVRVTKKGRVRKLNTGGLTEGLPVYANATGGYTQTVPAAPNYFIHIGIVEVAHAVNGIIDVDIQINYNLDDLSNVDGTDTTIIDTDLILKKDTAGIWKKVTWANTKTLILTYLLGLANTWSLLQTFTSGILLNSSLNIKIGEWTYNAVSNTADAVNDVRWRIVAGVKTYQVCTVLSITKGAGTWLTLESVDATGIKTLNSLIGTNNRILQASSTGVVGATQEIILGKLTDATAISILVNVASWDVNGLFVGTAITGTYEGQYYKNDDYFFTAYSDNEWLRLIRG